MLTAKMTDNKIKTRKFRLVRFLKAQLTAQIATGIDFMTTLALLAVTGLQYIYIVAIGAVVGGITNCIMNYRWVFQPQGCKKKYVAIKYLIVWFGSMMLNTFGTYFFNKGLWSFVSTFSFHEFRSDNVFIFSKVVVAVIIAVFWNYPLQKMYVYRGRTETDSLVNEAD